MINAMTDCSQIVEQSTEIFMVYFRDEIMIIVITVIEILLWILPGVFHPVWVHYLLMTGFIRLLSNAKTKNHLSGA